MSDNIPFEIQLEIMKRLPVKSLIQFRSVSRSWKSLIDSCGFIGDYSSQVDHIFVWYVNQVGRKQEQKYALIVDDDSFPHHKVSPTLPPSVEKLKHPVPIGCSHGLLCLLSCYTDGPFPRKQVAVIWNITIRKSVAVVLPNFSVGRGEYSTVFGFGVCRKTCDPKIVKIKHIGWEKDMGNIPDIIPWQVEVFTLSTGAWRPPCRNRNLPRTSLRFRFPHVVIKDEFLYWIATEWISMDDGLNDYNLIISFDITSEEFSEVRLPESLARLDHLKLSMSKLRESLVVVFECDVDPYNPVSVVWMMEDGVKKSFTKLFNIGTPFASGVIRVLGSTKRGEFIMEVKEQPYIPLDDAPLVVYEPTSKHVNSLGITGISSLFIVRRYEERLLLLNHPDFIIYDNGKPYIFKPES